MSPKLHLRGLWKRRKWTPLVKYNIIKDLEGIYTHSIPIKESQIIEELLSRAKK
jgi:hypothetical protein